MLNLTRIKLLTTLLSLVVLIAGCTEQPTKEKPQSQAETKIAPLVTTQWLSENLNSPDLVILDSSVFIDFKDGKMVSRSGKENYLSGHIPGARFADLTGALSAEHQSFEFVMPSPEDFVNAIEDLGINNTSRVVIYSSDNQTWSARVWWMLRWVGLEQVAILDGGLKAWKAEGKPISTELPSYSKGQFSLSLNPQMIVDSNEVRAAINDDQIDIVDALSEGHYSGKMAMYSRAGHITSAINMPVSDLFQPSAHYRPLDELDMQFDGDRTKRVITYCGGGIAGSSLAFTMYRLGYTDVAVYMGSLQEWVADPSNPMTLGHQPSNQN